MTERSLSIENSLPLLGGAIKCSFFKKRGEGGMQKCSSCKSQCLTLASLRLRSLEKKRNPDQVFSAITFNLSLEIIDIALSCATVFMN